MLSLLFFISSFFSLLYSYFLFVPICTGRATSRQFFSISQSSASKTILISGFNLIFCALLYFLREVSGSLVELHSSGGCSSAYMGYFNGCSVPRVLFLDMFNASNFNIRPFDYSSTTISGRLP